MLTQSPAVVFTVTIFHVYLSDLNKVLYCTSNAVLFVEGVRNFEREGLQRLLVIDEVVMRRLCASALYLLSTPAASTRESRGCTDPPLKST